MSVEQANKEALGQAIGRLSSGVYIMTLQANGENHGMLATWIIQAAFEPPMLTVAVQRKRDILPFMQTGTKICVNALSKKNMDIFKAFAKPFQEGLDRFDGLKVLDRETSAPVFAEALSYLDCTVKSQMDAEDHVVFLCEISGGEFLNNEEPMLHTRKNGFQY